MTHVSFLWFRSIAYKGYDLRYGVRTSKDILKVSVDFSALAGSIKKEVYAGKRLMIRALVRDQFAFT